MGLYNLSGKVSVMFVAGLSSGGFLRALQSLALRSVFVVILISGNAHLPAEVIWNQREQRHPALHLSPCPKSLTEYHSVNPASSQ